ncbi:2-dehydropantoate 2-reductase [Sphingomonas endophytica]|uniref:2-dehydropantoate 2-reductase n=1 Tax=Sphingomonas endophytica TaxID=869719 RepID=A0A147HZF2_9SPHN|nr:2-dehydropantoate 2-reductase [Sphingomonas endophytica]KTT70422.1 2-dehydropantoate 2-reductase [Sphingomonas endophytica]
MKVGIVGAGAIGCWLGARFAAAGHDVSVFARGATLDALREHGLRLTDAGETQSYPVTADEDASVLGKQDLVIVAVKAPAMAAVAPAVGAMTGPDTIIIPAMNGVPWWFANGLRLAEEPTRKVVDPTGAIGANIPASAVVGCVVHASTALVGPGHARRNMSDVLIFGEPAGKPSERVAKVVETFESVGLKSRASDNIRHDIWYKLWGNMTMNPVSAITGATADRIIDDPDVRSLLMAVMAEAATVGGLIGCPIDEPGENRIDVTRKLGAFRTSMLQDVDAGRPIELDALLGAPRAIAGALGVPTPSMNMLYGLTRVFARTRGLLP